MMKLSRTTLRFRNSVSLLMRSACAKFFGNI
jgi:hypothetical protein